jgi:hypothetical protein
MRAGYKKKHYEEGDVFRISKDFKICQNGKGG